MLKIRKREVTNLENYTFETSAQISSSASMKEENKLQRKNTQNDAIFNAQYPNSFWWAAPSNFGGMDVIPAQVFSAKERTNPISD